MTHKFSRWLRKGVFGAKAVRRARKVAKKNRNRSLFVGNVLNKREIIE